MSSWILVLRRQDSWKIRMLRCGLTKWDNTHFKACALLLKSLQHSILCNKACNWLTVHIHPLLESSSSCLSLTNSISLYLHLYLSINTSEFLSLIQLVSFHRQHSWTQTTRLFPLNRSETGIHSEINPTPEKSSYSYAICNFLEVKTSENDSETGTKCQTQWLKNA